MDAASVLKKLRLSAGHKALIVNAPEAFIDMLEGFKYDTIPMQSQEGAAYAYDYVQIFASSYDELITLLQSVEGVGKYDCLFWASYPKLTGKIVSDLKRELVWQALGTINLDAVSQVAIDGTWSALRARPLGR